MTATVGYGCDSAFAVCAVRVQGSRRCDHRRGGGTLRAWFPVPHHTGVGQTEKREEEEDAREGGETGGGERGHEMQACSQEASPEPGEQAHQKQEPGRGEPAGIHVDRRERHHRRAGDVVP